MKEPWITYEKTKLHTIHTLFSNCYIIQCKNKTILVDTGRKSQRKKIIKYFKDNRIYKLDAIMITHIHPCQCGNVTYLQSIFKCPVYAESKEGSLLFQGKVCYSSSTFKPLQKLDKFIKRLSKRFEPCESFHNINELPNDMELNNIRLLATPGHTMGSITLLIDNEFALVGDTMTHRWNDNIYPLFAQDTFRLKTSWHHLLETECRMFFSSYGNSIDRELAQKNYHRIKLMG